LIALPSSGLHTNGYSLARRIAFETARLSVGSMVPELGAPVGDALLVPHRSYLEVIRAVRRLAAIKGMAHITGGGITENLPRILPPGTCAVVDRSAWRPPAVFEWLQRAGRVPDADMLRTFNMGVGLIIVAGPEHERTLMDGLAAAGEPGAARIGEIRSGDPGVQYIP
jgi:phosphoribosylformylglycinamidine cyclo-ligase